MSSERRAPAAGSARYVRASAAEVFTAPGDEMERIFYGFSLFCCLPTGMAEAPSAETGTVMRPDTLRDYVRAAGFADAEVLDIEHPQFRLYRLV